MTTETHTPLTRDQKLQAEQIVQLGNIAEAIRAHTAGHVPSTQDDSAVHDLQAQLAQLSEQNNVLAAQLQNATGIITNLQSQLAAHNQGDHTPDSVAEVISHLGIEVGE